MDYRCLLRHRPKMNPPAPCIPGPNCKSCGWESMENERRKKLIAKNGLMLGDDGMKHFIITAV